MLGYQGISMAFRSGDDPNPIAGKIPRTRQDIVRIITSAGAEHVSGTSPRLGKSCKIGIGNIGYHFFSWLVLTHQRDIDNCCWMVIPHLFLLMPSTNNH